MSSNPSLSVNPLLGTLSCSFTPQINLLLTVFYVYIYKITLKAHPSTNAMACHHWSL